MVSGGRANRMNQIQRFDVYERLTKSQAARAMCDGDLAKFGGVSGEFKRVLASVTGDKLPDRSKKYHIVRLEMQEDAQA